MLFASANRWQGDLTPTRSMDDPFDPRAIWKLWNTFGISSATMYGWWLAEEGSGVAPIVTNSSDVKCTAFVKRLEGTLIVLANFGAAQAVRLSYDWNVLC